MKSLMSLTTILLQEIGEECDVCTARDLKTITSRTENEGISFLTITLAQFGSDFERCLELGYVDDDLFNGFRRVRGGLPAFLQGFLRQIFGTDLCLLDTPSIACIRGVRQLTKAFSKINLPCTKTRERKAYAKYVETDKAVGEADGRLSEASRADFQRISRLLFGDVLSRVNENVYNGEIVPTHGSGATADQVLGNQKWSLRQWTERLESVFPYLEYGCPSYRDWEQALSRVQHLSPGAERPVKVITVPKTLKTPRIIAEEPATMMFIQQGIMRCIKDAVDADYIASRLIGWSSQLPNQQMARQGSLDRSLATLDLSEASDRVSNQHVIGLLADHTWLLAGVQACRSTKADVPGHGVITLSKFASMGSALTFPLEAMVFSTVVFMGIEEGLGHRLTRNGIKSFLGSVRVYGDDIIIPVEYTQPVLDALNDFGFVVNTSKSFWRSSFRESCGKEYYAGHDVSIVKIRHTLPKNRRNAKELISIVSLRNQLYFSGYWATVKYLDGIIERLIPFPVLEETSPGLGRHSFLKWESELSRDGLQRPVVKAAVVSPVRRMNSVNDWGALLKWFTYKSRDSSSEPLPPLEEDHLQYSGRPQRLRTKLRWVTPY